MYTKGEFDRNLQRMMESDSYVASQSLKVLAKYVELHTKLEFLDKLKEYPDLCEKEQHKEFLKQLAEEAGFRF